MDDLIISGVIALLVFYAGIAVVVYGIIRVLLLVAQAALAGNYLKFGGLVAGIAAMVLAYIIIGLWLRRTGTI
ncbi:hypothetical protein [Methanoregula sp.]|uniref:hypothetical protein n=1 Tax=Methanoregula sp. TaxID=2052170 RepID=UPI003BB09D78